MATLPAEFHTHMQAARAVAATTPPADVPVGAIIYAPDGHELARATNRKEADNDPTAHAEVLAIRQAVNKLGDSWRLEGCTLVVTLEPCPMCTGAILASRIRRVLFGAYEPKTGALGSVVDLAREIPALHPLEVRGGIQAEECEALLTTFFNSLRW